MGSALLSLSMLAAACGDADADAAAVSDGPQIVVTTSIWADVVSNVACDNMVSIDTLIPIGGDPHSFEPSLADRARMESAELIVANGLLLEEGLEDTIDAVEDGGAPVFRFGDVVETIAYGGDSEHDEDHEDEDEDDHGDEDADHADGDEHDDEDKEHGDDEHEDEDDHGDEDDADDHDDDDHGDAHSGDDPHIWFDPQRVSAAIPLLAERLVEDVGLDEAAVDRCVADYQAELADLDTAIAALADGLARDKRILVTNHDALGYFADRYGFDVIGTVIPAPSGLAETNPAQLEALAEVIEETGVPVVFAETQRATDDADALADRVGDISVVTLPTGTLGADGDGTYVAYMRTNATLIVEALR